MTAGLRVKTELSGDGAAGEQRESRPPSLGWPCHRSGLALALTNLTNLCLLFLLCSCSSYLQTLKPQIRLCLVFNANMINDKTLTDTLTALIPGSCSYLAIKHQHDQSVSSPPTKKTTQSVQCCVIHTTTTTTITPLLSSSIDHNWW